MPIEWRKRAFPTPASVSGHPLRSICFDIPDVAEYRQALWGHLWELGKAHVWQRDSTADDKDEAVAAYWREILSINYQRWLDLEECEADTCRDYPPSAGFIQWFPNDPFLTPDLIGDGYNNPAWYLATPASNIAYGSSPGDVITSLDRFPPGSLPSVIPASGLPRFRINVSGAGTVKATLVNLFGGSLIQTTTDDDIGTLKFIDVSRDTVSVPPETQTELAVEFEFTTPGAHHIDFIVVSWVNSSIPFLHHGGGLRKVELCGFETMPVVTPPFRFTEGCGLEYYNGEEWLPVDGWTEFAPECFTADATIVRSNPAGFGNMQQNIGGAGYTDIASSDYVRRDGAYPMVGGLEINNAQTTEPAIVIRNPSGSTQPVYQVYDATGVLRQELLSNNRFLHYGTLGFIRFDGGGNDITMSRIGANYLTANDITDATTTLRMRVGGVESIIAYTSGRASIGTAGFRNAALHIQALNAAYVALIARPAASNTSDIIQATDSAGNMIARVRPNGSGEFGVNDAVNNNSGDGLSIYHQATTAALAGFGVGLRWQGNSSTTAKRDMALLRAVWETPTDASRKAQVVLSAFDTAEREILRGGTDGAVPKIGFLGAVPVIRQPIAGDAQGNELLYDLVAALSSYGLLNVTGVTLGVTCCEQLEACTIYDFRVAQYNSEWSVTDGNWQDGVGIGPDAITGVIRMNLTVAPDDMHMTFLEVTGTNQLALFSFDIFVYSDNNANIWTFTHSPSTPWLRSSTFPFPHEILGNLNIEITGDPESPPVIETVTIRYLAEAGVPPGGEECE